MSDTPPFNPRSVPATIGMEHGIYAPPPQNVAPGMQISQPDPRMNFRPQSQPQQNQAFYSQQQPQQPQSHVQHSQVYGPPTGYAPLPRPADMSMPHQGAYQYPSRQQQPVPPQAQLPPNMMALPDTAPMFTTFSAPPLRDSYLDARDQYPGTIPDKPPTSSNEAIRESSPKPQRKAKGHVAAACMPCKRAHLKCDSARPCSRCCSTGKEDSCIDTQHKKRGRPRLRDDHREARYENTSQPYPLPINPNTRGLVPIGAGRRPADVASPMAHPSNMSQSYPPRPPPMNGEVPCAFLTLDFLIERTSRSLNEVLSMPDLTGQRLFDLIVGDDRQRVFRIQNDFQHERQQRDSGYLPPIYPPDRDRERIINSLGMSADEMSQFRLDRQETVTFQPPGTYLTRRFPIRMGLEKIESTWFVVLVISIPQVQQDMRPVYPQNPHMQQVPQYGNSSPQHSEFSSRTGSFGSYGGMPFDPRLRDQMPVQPGPYGAVNPYDRPGGNVPAHQMQQAQMMTPSYAQSFPSPGYPMQQPRDTPRSHHPTTTQPQPSAPPPRSNEFQLPPIRAASGSVPSPRRLDIEELLEDPKAKRGGQ